MTTIKKSDLVLSLGQRLLLLLCIFLICYLLTMGSAYIIGRALGSNPAAAIRITTVIQDLMTFIVPAVATAVFVTRRPADLLCLTRSPRIVFFIGILAILVVSIPVQEAIIYWNHNITLPQSMSAFEDAARTMENSAFQAMATLLSDTSVPALAVNILIIGILAGLSEELLFRGCFQRLLTTGGVNRHVAIWTVAICFSALHFQLFGFVPRILLGAYFGYLLLWSGSLWAPVTAIISCLSPRPSATSGPKESHHSATSRRSGRGKVPPYHSSSRPLSSGGSTARGSEILPAANNSGLRLRISGFMIIFALA